MEKELPKGWVETELSSILKLKNGYAFRSSEYKEEGIPVIRISDIQDGLITSEKAVCVDEFERADDFIVEKGDILIAMSGATTGKFGVFNDDYKAYQNQRVGNLKPIDSSVDKKFIYYLVGNLKKEIEEKAYGGAQPNISAKLIEEIEINLPPFKEQQRIVTKLDQLFSHLETAKKGLEKIPVLLKQFRQAVLTQAVTGKLTEEWREGKEIGEWKYEKASECCKKVQSGGTPKQDGYDTTGIPFLKVYNIVNNKIDFDYKPQYITEYAQNHSGKKSIAFPGDVIMNIVGPPMNKVAIIPDTYPEWNLNQAITIFRPKEFLNNNFLFYFFCEGFSVRSVTNETRGVVGQVNISLSQCRDFIIPIPHFDEQTEIVRRVEALFAKADAIEARYKILKEKIDNLPQAVLAKAFRGEM